MIFAAVCGVGGMPAFAIHGPHGRPDAIAGDRRDHREDCSGYRAVYVQL